MIKIYNSNAEEVRELMNRKFEYDLEVEETVKKVLDLIKANGEKEVFKYTEMFDKAEITSDNFQVKEKEIKRAFDLVEDDFIENINEAAENIVEFHKKQKSNSWLEKDLHNNLLGQMYQPINRTGIYVPGGTAAYPSSVLMNAIPAKVAGVNEIAMVSPPAEDGTLNPYTLVAAKVAGVNEIFKVGGAQAVGALTFGAGALKSVDKITGPGNIFVTVAKKLVYGIVDIDMLAGPSEILIIADEKAKPEFIAADLLSQAEHDPLAAAILVTHKENLAVEVQKELKNQIKNLSRKDIIKKSLNNYGTAVITKNLKESIMVANNFASEHLELLVENPFDILPEIKNAGAIFMGEWTPEPVGDYFAGPNHILPTGGTARFYSPVTVETFMKKSSIIYYKKDNLLKNGEKIINLAEKEGLDAHANAVSKRLKK